MSCWPWPIGMRAAYRTRWFICATGRSQSPGRGGATGMTESYRGHFDSAEEAARYEQGEYAGGSYSHLLWELEQAALAPLVTEFRHNHPHLAYLDFASGTGRLASFLEERVDAATAIEISESMAAMARRRLRRTQV